MELEVACFQGGYGIDFFEQRAREYEKLHPDVKIKLWGNPRVWEQLRPRFSAGTPPDLVWPGWGMNTFQLIFGNQLLPMDQYLEKPAEGVQKPWKDTFVQSLLKKGAYGGHYYVLPYNFDAFGWWYNKAMFRKYGWEVPRTYGELLKLCDKIKEKGIAPITFTGRYPEYMLKGFYLPWVISAGGLDVFNRAQNLEPGAFKDPAFVKAAEKVLEMKHAHNFQAGCVGMNHTESQMEFLVGRAAMIPCGTWLHSEMKKLLPADFEMEFMLCPVFEDGIGDKTLVAAGPDGKGWCVPTQGKHHEIAVDFFRFLSSPENARRFVEQKGTLMSIKDLGDVKAPPHLKAPLKACAEASATWAMDMSDWYPEFNTGENNAMRDLYNEVLTPTQFCDRLEELAKAVRDDPTIRKFKVQ